MAAAAAPPAVPLVNLAQTIHLLHSHLTAVLCNTVFQRVRNRERQRRWSLAALVYAAMRVAQAHIAQDHQLPPEQLSPAKLFPRVARASMTVADAELYFEATQRLNPRVRLTKPDWAELPPVQVPLEALLVQRRHGKRRKRRYCASRRRWKSFTHLPGARKFGLS